MAPQKSDACLFLKPFTFFLGVCFASFVSDSYIISYGNFVFAHLNGAILLFEVSFFFASLVCLLLSSSIAWEYDHYAEYKYI